MWQLTNARRTNSWHWKKSFKKKSFKKMVTDHRLVKSAITSGTTQFISTKLIFSTRIINYGSSESGILILKVWRCIFVSLGERNFGTCLSEKIWSSQIRRFFVGNKHGHKMEKGSCDFLVSSKEKIRNCFKE